MASAGGLLVAAANALAVSAAVTGLDHPFLCAFGVAVQERFEYIQSQLLPFLKSVGFKEQSLQWLPAVGPAGQNLKDPPTEPLLSWWKGPTLVQAIDAFVPKARNSGKAWGQGACGWQACEHY